MRNKPNKEIKSNVIRISSNNYYWLMNLRGAGSIDDILTILKDHVNECEKLKNRLKTELSAEYIHK